MRTYVRMTHSRYLRDMARLLRMERQLTVDQLAKRLALPRSTIYYWVRDLPLRPARPGPAVSPQAPAGPRAEGRDAGLAIMAREREHAYEEGLRSYDDLIAQPTFRDFVCTYVTEGYKRDRSRVALAGGDPAVVRLAHRWIWRLTDESPTLVLHHDDAHSMRELQRFWSETIGEDARAIRMRRGDAARLVHRWSPRPLHGVLAVSVEDALLRARLQAWMRRIRESWR
jgi:hypothetical protein